MLVYSLPQTGAIFDRFGGITGSAYLVGGFGMTALTGKNIVVVPIRSGGYSATDRAHIESWDVIRSRAECDVIAIGEILFSISGSMTDPGPVFDAHHASPWPRRARA